MNEKSGYSLIVSVITRVLSQATVESAIPWAASTTEAGFGRIRGSTGSQRNRSSRRWPTM